MVTIPSVDEAIQAMKVLERFLEGFQAFVGKPTANSTEVEPPRSRVATPRAAKGSWRDRVLGIMTQSGRPMRPAEITKEYLKSGYPNRKNLPSQIRSTLLYSLKTGHVVKNGDGAYRPAS